MVYGIGFTDSCGSARVRPCPHADGRRCSSVAARPAFHRHHLFREAERPGRPDPRGRRPRPSPSRTSAPRIRSDTDGRRQCGPRFGCESTRPDPDCANWPRAVAAGISNCTGPTISASTFARVADELHHQYLLAFTPVTLDGTMHTLDVRLRDHSRCPFARGRRTWRRPITESDPATASGLRWPAGGALTIRCAPYARR